MNNLAKLLDLNALKVQSQVSHGYCAYPILHSMVHVVQANEISLCMHSFLYKLQPIGCM